MNVSEWNKKIYKNEDDSWCKPDIGADELWEQFEIKSHPKFRGECYSHIPKKWWEDVSTFLGSVKKELGDRIEFKQIKEKWCCLTVYYDSKDEDARNRLKELQAECVDKLIGKGVHPPM